MKKLATLFTACLLSVNLFSQYIVNKEIDDRFSPKQKKEYYEAINRFRNVVETNPNALATIHSYINVEAAEKNPLMYLVNSDIYKHLIEKYPFINSAISNRGSILLRFSKSVGDNSLKLYGDEIRELFTEAERLSLQGGAYNLACYYSLTGDVDEALKWLETAVTKKYKDIMQNGGITRERLDSDTDFDPIRSNPRFLDFLNKHFPAK